MKYLKIDPSTGLFVEDVLLDKPPYKTQIVTKTRYELKTIFNTLIDTTQEITVPIEYQEIVPVLVDGHPVLQDEYVDVPCPDGFYHPKWTGTEWTEGGQAPPVTPPTPTEQDRIDALESAVLELIMGGA